MKSPRGSGRDQMNRDENPSTHNLADWFTWYDLYSFLLDLTFYPPTLPGKEPFFTKRGRRKRSASLKGRNPLPLPPPGNKVKWHT